MEPHAQPYRVGFVCAPDRLSASSAAADVAARSRLGYDVTKLVRVGADGQFRYRLAGSTRLFNSALWDLAAGPQILIGTSHFFGALTGGPTTMGLTKQDVVGWTVVASVGGAL